MEKLKPVLMILAVVIAIYVGIKLVPPYYNDWQFSDFIDGEARIDTYNLKPEAEIHKDIMRAARDNDIPITDDKVVIQRGNGTISIEAKYTVHVDLPGYPLDLNFDAGSKNKNPVVR
ncbi:MAG: DUF4845 domain-containing protein [Terriglobales bacterium]|jgi:hypothetical protein